MSASGAYLIMTAGQLVGALGSTTRHFFSSHACKHFMVWLTLSTVSIYQFPKLAHLSKKKTKQNNSLVTFWWAQFHGHTHHESFLPNPRLCSHHIFHDEVICQLKIRYFIICYYIGDGQVLNSEWTIDIKDMKLIADVTQSGSGGWNVKDLLWFHILDRKI